jgi:hypothetical protein
MENIMTIGRAIYTDGVISIALVKYRDKSVNTLAIKYLRPQKIKGKGSKDLQLTNAMGGETDWFILPSTIAAATARLLMEQKAAGLPGFKESSFKNMVQWLVEIEEVHDCMCY